MKKSMMKLLALATVAAGVMLADARTEAASLPGQNGLRPAVDSLALIETVQGTFFYNGRRYCWYDVGWNGPGWYWCGYAGRRGFGWGGARGFRGWWWGGWGPRRGGGGPTIIIRPGPMMGGPGPGPMMGGPGPGPMMGGPGPMMGGPGSEMSDIRAKQAIALVGHLENGLGLYRFQYIGDQQVYVGVMAHEVQTVRPDAVVRGADGYLRVDYTMLGVRMQTWEQWTAR